MIAPLRKQGEHFMSPGENVPVFREFLLHAQAKKRSFFLMGNSPLVDSSGYEIIDGKCLSDETLTQTPKISGQIPSQCVLSGSHPAHFSANHHKWRGVHWVLGFGVWVAPTLGFSCDFPTSETEIFPPSNVSIFFHHKHPQFSQTSTLIFHPHITPTPPLYSPDATDTYNSLISILIWTLFDGETQLNAHGEFSF